MCNFYFRYMSVDEVRAWIIPPDFDHTEAEARHLMEESDTDHDEKLTKQVGSLAMRDI